VRDRDAARMFAAEELGPVAAPTPAAAELRRTLTAFFAAGHDQSRAARDLGVHRNTVAKRLRRAEGLIGHTLEARVRELDTALAIAEVLAEEG
jgi:DNA-binding PucR family transcriptional regulator